MTTKELTVGNPLKLILIFMFPIFLGNIFQQFYNLFDALIVGRLIGIEALGAIGSTGALIFLVISFIFASTQGFSVVLAQKFGAKDYNMVKKSLASSLILSFGLTIILTIISTPFTRPLLELLRTPIDIIDMANEYLFIMFAGIFATVYYNISANTIRALGDSKTPLYFLILSSFLNILMDIIFIAVFKMGIFGAGIATVVAQAISTVLCMIYMFIKFPILRLKIDDWKVDKDFLMEHLRIGIPMGFQMSVLTLGMIAIQFVLNGFGSIAVSSFTTAMRLDQIFCQIYLALGATMAVYTAQNFGANKLSRIKEGIKISLIICAIISVFTIFVLGLFSKPLVALFMQEPNQEIIRLASQYLHIIMLFFMFLGILFIFRNVLQGMGSVITPLISGVAELLARGFGAFILAKYFGYLGLCFATPMAWVLGALVLYIGYKISLIKNFRRLKEKNLKTL